MWLGKFDSDVRILKEHEDRASIQNVVYISYAAENDEECSYWWYTWIRTTASRSMPLFKIEGNEGDALTFVWSIGYSYSFVSKNSCILGLEIDYFAWGFRDYCFKKNGGIKNVKLCLYGKVKIKLSLYLIN